MKSPILQSRPQCHLSPLRPLSANLPVWSPTPQSCPAATAAAYPPSVAVVCPKLQEQSSPQVTIRPTNCLHLPPCQTLSPVARTSPSAERTRHRHPTVCTRGTTPAGLCRFPTVSPFPHRRTPQPCRPNLTSSAQAAWSWMEPPTLESPDRGLCPGRCLSYRCWLQSTRKEMVGRKKTGIFCTFLHGTHFFLETFNLAFLTYTPVKDTSLHINRQSRNWKAGR